MHLWFYRMIAGIGRRIGLWFVAWVSWLISSWFFFFFPKRLKTSLHFYKALFPERSLLSRLRLSWRQYHSFAALYAERLRYRAAGKLEYQSEGWEHIQNLQQQGKGGILLMSHVGSWEAAAFALQSEGLRIMAYMGSREGEPIEEKMRQDLRRQGIEIVAVASDGGSPLDGLAGIRFVRDGGFLTLSADRLWREDQPSIQATFLGHRVCLPKAPFAFALSSHAPLIVFFITRDKTQKGTPGEYRFTGCEPIYVEATSRSERDLAMQQAAQRYLSYLEETLRNTPEQWYHFEAFLGEKVQ